MSGYSVYILKANRITSKERLVEDYHDVVVPTGKR